MNSLMSAHESPLYLPWFFLFQDFFYLDHINWSCHFPWFLLFQILYLSNLYRVWLAPQPCLLFWLGGMPVLLACPQMMSS